MGQDLCKSLLIYYNTEFLKFGFFKEENKQSTYVLSLLIIHNLIT